MRNPYEVLGVNNASTNEEIKKAFYSLVRKYHPDIFIHASEKEKSYNKTMFDEIQASYLILTDSVCRKYLDSKLKYLEESEQVDFSIFLLSESEKYNRVYNEFYNVATSNYNLADGGRDSDYHEAERILEEYGQVAYDGYMAGYGDMEDLYYDRVSYEAYDLYMQSIDYSILLPPPRECKKEENDKSFSKRTEHKLKYKLKVINKQLLKGGKKDCNKDEDFFKKLP